MSEKVYQQYYLHGIHALRFKNLWKLPTYIFCGKEHETANKGGISISE